MDAQELQAALGHWRGWIGRSERRSDVIAAAPLAGLAATLDRDEPEPAPGDEIPPLAHWLYFARRPRASRASPRWMPSTAAAGRWCS